MEFTVLLVVIAGAATAVTLTRRFALPALFAVLAGSLAIGNALLALPLGSKEALGLSLTVSLTAQLLLFLGFGLNAFLAILLLLQPETRDAAPMLFWTWVPWSIALLVDGFPLSVLAWAFGLLILSLALRPRRTGRVGGGANYLILVALSVAALLIANRFLELYPLTPEQVQILQTSLLLMAWAFGLLLAIVPLHLWLPAFADEAPAPVLVTLTALGQPLGLMLLFGLMRRYLWLTERSDLLNLLEYAGIATTVVAGLFAATERRANRVLAYASLFTFGIVLVGLGRGRLDMLWTSALEVYARGLALACLAAGLTVFSAARVRWVQAGAILGVALGGAALVGFPLTPAFAAHLPLWAELAVADLGVFVAFMLAALGMWIGVLNVLGPMVKSWRGEAAPAEELASSPALAAPMLPSGDNEIPTEMPALAAALPVVEPVMFAKHAQVAVGRELPGATEEHLPPSDQALGEKAESPSETEMETQPGESGSSETTAARIEAGVTETDTQAGKQGAAEENPQTIELETQAVDSQAPQKPKVEEEPYDPIKALREVWAQVWALIRGASSRAYRTSPRLWQTLGVFVGHWPAWIGLFALLAAAAAILFSGLYPSLMLEAITTALGRPEYLK